LSASSCSIDCAHSCNLSLLTGVTAAAGTGGDNGDDDDDVDLLDLLCEAATIDRSSGDESE